MASEKARLRLADKCILAIDLYKQQGEGTLGIRDYLATVIDADQMYDSIAENIDLHNDVLEFHKKFGLAIEPMPTIAEPKTALLRANLLLEELLEIFYGLEFALVCPRCSHTVEHPLISKDERWSDSQYLDKIADGCIDLLYVTIGLLIGYGIDFRPLWKAVHKANMAKDGGKKRQDGKQLKPEGWVEPDITGLLEQQEPIF